MSDLTEAQLRQVKECVALVLAGGEGDWVGGGLGTMQDWNTLMRAAEKLGLNT